MVHRRTAIYFRDPKTQVEPVKRWLDSLKDGYAQAAVYVRIARAESGNFGDHRSVGEGVMEMRISMGPGYRLYYALEGQDVILLLVGGDKSTQPKDIMKAKKYWTAHKAEVRRG